MPATYPTDSLLRAYLAHSHPPAVQLPPLRFAPNRALEPVLEPQHTTCTWPATRASALH